MLSLRQFVLPGTQLPAAIGDLGTVDANCNGEMIKRLTFHNTNTTVEAVEIRILKSGGTTGAEYTFKKKSLAPDETYSLPDIEGHFLLPGDKLQGTTITVDKVNVFCTSLRDT